MNRPVTTVSTTLQNMTDKGLLIQEKSQRKSDGFFYTPRVTREELMIHAVQLLMADLKASPRERQRVSEAVLRWVRPLEQRPYSE